MGRRVDRWALFLLGMPFFYGLSLRLTDSIAASAALTSLLLALLRQLIRRSSYFQGNRMSRAQAEAILFQWACLSEEEAFQRITGIVGKRDNLVCIARHPSLSLSLGDVFSVWKNHRDEDRLVIASTVRADARAKGLARTLHHPRVELIDAPCLIRFIRRSDLMPPKIPAGQILLRRLRDGIAHLCERRSWLKGAAIGLLLMFLYLLTGNVLYLALSVADLFFAGISLRNRLLR